MVKAIELKLLYDDKKHAHLDKTFRDFINKQVKNDYDIILYNLDELELFDVLVRQIMKDMEKDI